MLNNVSHIANLLKRYNYYSNVSNEYVYIKT